MQPGTEVDLITEEPSAAQVAESTAEKTEEENGEVTAETADSPDMPAETAQSSDIAAETAEVPAETADVSAETAETAEAADVSADTAESPDAAAETETAAATEPVGMATAGAAAEGDQEAMPSDDLSTALDVGGDGEGAIGPRPGYLPAWWTDAYPQVSDVASATAYLDTLGGAMSRKEENGRWVLSTGDQVLFEADTSQELDGFILGFALSQLIAERHGPIAHARRN